MRKPVSELFNQFEKIFCLYNGYVGFTGWYGNLKWFRIGNILSRLKFIYFHKKTKKKKLLG